VLLRIMSDQYVLDSCIHRTDLLRREWASTSAVGGGGEDEEEGAEFGEIAEGTGEEEEGAEADEGAEEDEGADRPVS
jgi:hypothetical protein